MESKLNKYKDLIIEKFNEMKRRQKKKYPKQGKED